MIGIEDQIHYDKIEQKVLGAIGVEPSLLTDIEQILTPEMFTKPILSKVFGLCLELHKEGSLINDYSLTHLARKRPELGVQMMDVVEALQYASPMECVGYAKSVAERWIKIKVKQIVDKASVQSTLETSDAFELLSGLITQLEVVNGGASNTEAAQTANELVSGVVEYLKAGVDGMASGVPSGLTQIDEMTNGWQEGDLIIIAARPAMGKSAFVTTIMKNAADSGYPVAISS